MDSDDNVVSECAFESENENVAVIDENGVITGVAEGICKIRAIKDNKNAVCEVAVLEKNVTTPEIQYRGHVQDIGWQPYSSNGQIIGTTGKSLRLEAVEINLLDKDYSSGIMYSVYVHGRGLKRG